MNPRLPDRQNLTTLGAEEFHNANAADRPVLVRPRECQTPMFPAVARMDLDDAAVTEPEDLPERYHVGAQERWVDFTESPSGASIPSPSSTPRSTRPWTGSC